MSIGLGLVAAGLTSAIVWLQWPRPPVLDGERWFKVALATVLRGEVEARGGDPVAWEDAVRRWVPYHPAGREPERKVSNPSAALLPGAALPGELALVEALAKLPEPGQRWARLYDTDDLASGAVLDDPAELGSDYDLDCLAPGAGWDALAAWGAGEGTFGDLAAQASAARWVLLEGRQGRLGGPSLLPALAELLDDPLQIPFDTADLGAALRGALPDNRARLILVAEEAAVMRLLRDLAEAGDVRDQVVAVVSVGGVIGGRTDEPGAYGEVACRDWLEARFAQRVLDTDVVRLTPYFCLQWLDRTHWPPGVPGLPIQASRFPVPSEEGATAITLEVVDLGPLPADPQLPVGSVARALIAVVSAWVVRRR